MNGIERPEVPGPGLLGWPRKLLRDARSEGLLEVAGWGVRLFYTRYREWRLGIQTRGNVYWDDSEIDPACVNYQPLGYANLDFLFDHQQIRKGEDTFLDYGSGKGRVLAVAATRPFKRVIGVEMSAELCALSRQNLDFARGRRCGAVEIVHADATAYRVPTDVNVIYMYNPFTGHVLDTVTQQIRASLVEAPRKLRILYVVHEDDRVGLATCKWLTEVSFCLLPSRKHIRCFQYENSEHTGT